MFQLPLHPRPQLVEVDRTCTSARWRAQATFRRRDQAGESAGVDSRPPGGSGGAWHGAARALQRGAETPAGRMNTGEAESPRDFRFAKVLCRWKEQATRRQSTWEGRNEVSKGGRRGQGKAQWRAYEAVCDAV